MLISGFWVLGAGHWVLGAGRLIVIVIVIEMDSRKDRQATQRRLSFSATHIIPNWREAPCSGFWFVTLALLCALCESQIVQWSVVSFMC